MSDTNHDKIITQNVSEGNEIRSSYTNPNIFSKSRQPNISARIYQTLIEHGVRLIGGDSTGNDPLSRTGAIRTLSKQHANEQQDLQDLNAKFAAYLTRVQHLESCNQRLTADLRNLRQTWGSDTNQLQTVYESRLQALRNKLNDITRDRALQELQSKRYEYDIWQIHQQISAIDPNYDSQRLSSLKHELDRSSLYIEQLRYQFDRRLADVKRLEYTKDNLQKERNNLKTELDNQQLEDATLSNELQTLREHSAFLNSLYQVQREELLYLDSPILDVWGFYHSELARAISDIRHDFEILSQSQANELEEYYRIKIEQVRQEIESENERKRELANAVDAEAMDTTAMITSINNNQNELTSLKTENANLQKKINTIYDDLKAIQGEKLRELELCDRELEQIQQQIADKRETIDNILENNTSLRFEISTYRGLLAVEEKHLNRMETDAQLQSLLSAPISTSLPYQNQYHSNKTPDDPEIKKMTIHKTVRGPISFDSVDLESDSIVLINERFTGSEQSFQNWSIRRQVDQQPEIVYQFPASFSLKPRQSIRILARRKAYSASTVGDRLLAARIDTWGTGQRMVTRLIDDKNEEKAVITQIFQ